LQPFDAILFDIGGVLLTNGWDHNERDSIFTRFAIDPDEYLARQSAMYEAWDLGKISAREFFDHTVFYTPRAFTYQQFWQAILDCSQVLEDGAMGILEEIAASNICRDGKCLLGALNNEPRETNQYRFEHFGLGRWLRVRLSSCYLGLHKPDPAYYHRAIDILGSEPQRILFIDDRIANVDAARQAGMQALLFEGSAKLRRELEGLGVLAVK
jgi:putative hydrolase of the HAD superfamily